MDLQGPSAIEREQALRRLVLENRRQARCLLATIRAVVTRTATQGYAIEEYAARLDGRLEALSRAQETYLLKHGRGAELAALVDAQLSTQAIDPDRVTVTGPPVTVSFRVALALSLALHELIVNAVRFGALSPRGGGVEVEWTQAVADDVVQLRWHEISTVAPAAPTSTGFGWELLQKALPREIGARVSVRLNWRRLDCAIEFHPHSVRRPSV